MRRLGVGLIIAVLWVWPAVGHATAFAPVDTPGPPLDVAAAQLAAALQCSSGVDHASRAPVLLIPGTGATAEQEFSWNYEPALTQLHIPWCALTFPDSGNDDVQINGEYVVYAIRTMYASAGRRIAIYGHSQGGMVPRWALRFWPDTRSMVDDVIGAAGPNHGTVVAQAACGVRKPCQPSDWQQAAGSHFVQALNSGQETFPGISYTEIYTHYDEEVQPNQNEQGTSSLHGGGGMITNVAVQDVCPNDVVEHLGVGSYDPVTWALVLDALDHPGPADPARIPLTVCAGQLMPGVDPATFPTNAANAVIAVETSPAQEVDAEPPLACYTTASCPGQQRAAGVTAGGAGCVAPHALSFRLHAARGDRVVAVTVYVNGRVTQHRRGRRISTVSVPLPPGGARIRIATLSERGVQRMSIRRVAGCHRSRPRTTVKRVRARTRS